MNQLFVIDGVSVRRDFDGRYCLNDLHRAAGGEKRHQPSNWSCLTQTQELIAEISSAPELQERPRWSPLLVVLTRGHSSARSWFIPMQCGSARNLTSKSSERSMPYRTLHQCADIRQNSGWRDPA
jgi:hypothetical protein